MRSFSKPNMEFIGTLRKSRFWWVKVGFRTSECVCHVDVEAFMLRTGAWAKVLLKNDVFNYSGFQSGGLGPGNKKLT